MSPQQAKLVTAARLIAPRPSLASCVRAYITRSNLGQPPLPAEQRRNRYPATVHCTLIWFIEGSALTIDSATQDLGRALPPALFCGPQTRPFASYNPGPVQVFAVPFFPDALHALTGVDMSRHVNRIAPLESVLDGAWLDLSRDVLAAPDDATRIALIERFLDPLWRAARARGTAPGSVPGDWINALCAYAASACWGLSARSAERRIKSWAGQPLRRLRRLTRLERSLVDARESLQTGALSWADLAARRGFSDQAHLCREVRKAPATAPPNSPAK